MRFLISSLLVIAALQMTSFAQEKNAKDLAEIWDKTHISRIAPSNVRHKDLKIYLEELKAMGLKVDEVGRSYMDREIYQVEWGTGPTKVFLWSQMHGDEPTATSTVIDMLAYLQKNPEEAWVKRMSETLTMRVVPMLNPDGAEFFQRRNLQGIDINRDAVALKTPEGRLLKKLRDDWKPVIGFNLHNQGELTAAGNSDNQASVSLLAVLGDPSGKSNPGFERNKRIASAMTLALREFIPRNLGRYDDSYNGLAFGDNFSAWGTPVILVETGGLHGRDGMYLVRKNFVALMTALQVIAEGGETKYDMEIYEQLPLNTSGRLMDFIFRNANVIEADGKATVTDIGINRERRRESFSTLTFIRGIGRLSDKAGLTEFDASGFNVVHRFSKVRQGEIGELLLYRKDRVIDWKVQDLPAAFEPDAVFSLGGWFKGEELMQSRRLPRNP